MNRLQKTATLFLVALVLGFSAGCASTERDTLSERPWNAPKSWEHGIPTGLANPRY